MDEQSEEADVTSEVAQINGHAAEESTEAGDGEPTTNGDELEGPNADGDGEPTGSADGDEEPVTAVDKGEPTVEGDEEVMPAKLDEEMGEEDIGEKTASKKRKLDEDEPSQAEGVKDVANTNGHVQVEESQADSGDEKGADSQVPDSDDPPSKKSKVDESS